MTNVLQLPLLINISKTKYTSVTFKKPVGKYTAVNSFSNDASWQFISGNFPHLNFLTNEVQNA